MKPQHFFIIVLIFFTCPLVGQDFISIVGKSPYPEQTKVFFEGYEGFKKTEIGSIRITENGHIDYFTDYHGYCLMKAEGYPPFPLILEHDPTCLEWDSIPVFTCENGNTLLYEMLPSMDTIQMLYDDLDKLDSLEKISVMARVDSLVALFQDRLNASDAGYAQKYLAGRLLILKAKMTGTTGEMEVIKSSIGEFIKNNIDQLYHSDLLIDLADAYTGMNAGVFSSTLSAQQASVYDVGEWLNLLGSGIPEKEVLDFFLLHFSAMDAYDIVGQLLQVHAGKYECEQYVGSAKRPANMPYTFTVFGGPELNREFTLDQFTGMRKILALYSSDCPSSVASLVALYGFISRNQVRLPVILVPGDEAEGEIATIIKNHAPFGMQTGMKLGSSLMLGAGIRQLPAYIILDQRNMLSDVFYSFEEIKNYLGDK